MVNNREEKIYEELQYLVNKLDALELIKSYDQDDCDVIQEMFYDDYIVPFREYLESYGEMDSLINNIKLKIKELESELSDIKTLKGVCLHDN